MMKYALLFVGLIAFAKANSQEVTSTASSMVHLQSHPAEKVVEDFFESFHAQDTTALRAFMAEGAALKSLSIKGEQRQVSSTSLDQFLTSIASIPAGVDFQEEVTGITSLGNESIASVHADYIFHLNGKKTHTGTNVFTVVWKENRWLIIQITDTRIY
ncbi:nuclear transport factor 2 family protein [Nonlabens marinus]|uniref:DUF4440 domain-containing protein n=1 Tax=Nonlabens marinus S1-08 TaxID=1454201 RepID=W8W0M0_9FLAO|nr:nuclear transport factor 2 family protein [Nonlabens marinus]BAO56561.1 hypothetical protein NMS_2552 [Nonlabens marinus S1-08]